MFELKETLNQLSGADKDQILTDLAIMLPLMTSVFAQLLNEEEALAFIKMLASRFDWEALIVAEENGMKMIGTIVK
jgi:hypothetical protein